MLITIRTVVTMCFITASSPGVLALTIIRHAQTQDWSQLADNVREAQPPNALTSLR